MRKSRANTTPDEQKLSLQKNIRVPIYPTSVMGERERQRDPGQPREPQESREPREPGQSREPREP